MSIEYAIIKIQSSIFIGFWNVAFASNGGGKMTESAKIFKLSLLAAMAAALCTAARTRIRFLAAMISLRLTARR